MNRQKTEIEAYFIDSFVSGIGVISEMTFLDFAKGQVVCRLWIDTDWEVNDFQYVKSLSHEQNELLMLNELSNQIVRSFKIDAANNINIIFSEVEAIFHGDPKDKNVHEPWRIFQLAPESKTLFIHSR